MAEEKKRISWIDGLRGLACFGVFINHFCACFLSEYLLNPTKYEAVGIVRLARSPFAVFIDGAQYYVLIFCIITGMLASLHVPVMNNSGINGRQDLANSLIKRYMRLVFPVFFVNLLVFLLLRFGAMNNARLAERIVSDWAGTQYYEYDSSSTILTLLMDTFIRIPFEGSTKYCLTYWTIPYLWYGYFFSVILSEMSWGKSKRIVLIYSSFAIALMLAKQDLMACFPVGTALALWTKNRSAKTEKEGIFGIFGAALILAGLFFGGFPIYTEPAGVFTYLNRSFLKIPPYMLWHFFGAFMTVAGLILCKPVQRLFSNCVFQFMGKISFGIFLLHIAVITSVGAGLAIYLIDSGGVRYSAICWIVLTAVLAVLLPSAWLFQRYVEKPCGKLSAYLVTKLNEPEE